MVVTVRSLARLALELFAELVAPSRCAACDELVGARVLFCAGCGPSAMRAEEQPAGQLSVFAYGGAIATAIVRMKYAGRPDLGARFAELLADAAAPLGDRIDVVVPVPLHPRRLAERGFDQAAVLAAPVARALGVAYAPRALSRTRETPRQASLDRGARAANVADAFLCVVPSAVAGQRVLLVDDVRTTGATLASCGAALRAAGAARVISLVLASRDRDRARDPDPEKNGPNVKKAPKYED